MEWKEAKFGPTDTWVVGYFKGGNAACLVKYTHERGWVDQDGDRAEVPTCWTEVPSAFASADQL